MKRLVRSATLSGYAEVARSLGLDPLQILGEAGIPRGTLDTADSLICASATCRLLEMSAAAAGVEDFGLRMCMSRQLSVLGPLGMVIQDAPTLRDALAALIRYLTLHSEAALLDIEVGERVFVIRMSLMVDDIGATRQANEMVLGSLYRILGELLGPAWRARRICLSHGAPKYMATHLQVFGGPIEFGCDFNGIVCELGDLDAVPPAAHPGLARYAHAYLDSLLARTNQSLAEKVRRMVFSLLPTGHCSVERVAGQLGIDRRTVHRRLMQEDITFSAILDEVRATLAVQYLGQPERSVSYVAELLGFSMHSAFARWFRCRFGCSPSVWRAHAARPVPVPPPSTLAASLQ